MRDLTLTLSPALRRFLQHLLDHHVEALAAGYQAIVVAHDLPLLRFTANLSAEERRALGITHMRGFLADLLDGTARAKAAENLAKWERDELPGIPKASFEPRELVLVGDAHERAMLGFLAAFATDAAEALAVSAELRAYFRDAELNAYETFTRIRDEALLERNEELQAANEELGAHHEELVTANEELFEQKTFIEGMVANMPTGIAYFDRAHVFRWVNDAFAAFAARPAADFPGRSYYDVFPFMEKPNPRFVAAFEAGQPTTVSAMSTHDGRSWDMVYVPVVGRDGHADGLLLLSQDVTDRVRAERLQEERIQRLQDVDRLKDEFLSILSHELRTPINAIMGFASILEDEVAGPLAAEQRRYAGRILHGAEVLLALIEDLLDMSRIQAGKFSLSPAAIDPAAVVEEALTALTALADQKGQTIVLAHEGEGAIEADPQRLRQIVTNLVGNAIKFGPPGDRLEVRLHLDAAGLRGEVEDHGPGIAASDLPRLFQRFTQLDMTATRAAGGTGLGLSIVKALVEAHGGEVGVRSQPGTRTVFWFTLPPAPVGAAPALG